MDNLVLNAAIEREVGLITMVQRITFQYGSKNLTEYFAKRIGGNSITEKFTCAYPGAKIQKVEILSSKEVKDAVKKTITEKDFCLF